MPRVHQLKTLSQYFDAVKSGDKTFETRINDRAFQTGDTLILERLPEKPLPPSPMFIVDSEPQIPIETLTATVSFVLEGGKFGIEQGYCVLGIRPVSPTQPAPKGWTPQE